MTWFEQGLAAHSRALLSEAGTMRSAAGDEAVAQLDDEMEAAIHVPAIFFDNSLELDAVNKPLISLRSRGLSNRPFEHVLDIQKQAELRYRDRERGLVKRLEDVEGKLKDLQTKEKAGGGAILSDKQKEAIEGFRRDIRKVRRELRDVRRDLREDIDTLDAWIKVLNIGTMPVLITLFAIVFLVVRNRQMRRRNAAPAT